MSQAVAEEEEEENFTLSPIDITSTEQLLITDQLKLYDMNLPPPEDLVIDDPSMSKIKYDNNSIAFGSYLTGIILLLTLLIFGFAIFGSFCWQNYLQIRDRENRNDNGRDDRFEYDENEVVDLEEGRTKNLWIVPCFKKKINFRLFCTE